MVATNDHVREGIEACSHCGQVMDVSALRPYSNAVCPSCGESTRVNDHMGQYRIIDKIGIGGMSVVYRAYDTILGREVALKVLNEQYGARSDRMARFEEEARLMARVNHGNIAKVYSVGHAYGCFYIAMELVSGGDLETRLRENGPIPEMQVLHIAEQVVGGLEAAWKAGMLHRDIKPANILMDSFGMAKVVDFGLSLLGGETMNEHEIWATPYYAPPETLMRQSEDFRSDMYAVGCTLFHLLVGKPPFEEIPESVTAMLKIKKALPRLEKVAPDISETTCRIINRLMAYVPGKRYGSYDELKEEIHNAIARLEGKEGVPVEQRRTLIRRGSRMKWRLAAAAASLVVLASAGAVAYFMLKPSSVEVPVADAPDLPIAGHSDDGAKEKGVDIGALFANAEDYLKKGDAVAARDVFAKILDLNDCPVSTYAWSALQSALCSWSIGNKYDGDLMLGRLQNFLEHAPKEEMTSGMKELLELTRYLTAKETGVQPVLQSGNASLFLLVANGLKHWETNDYKAMLESKTGLEKLAEGAKDDYISGQAAAWMKLLTPFFEDAGVLSSIDAMPDDTEKEVLEKQRRISEAMENRRSPGIAFRQMLSLMEKAANISLVEIRNNAVVPVPSEGQKTEVASADPNSPWKVDFKGQYSAVVSEMKGTWNFGNAVNILEKGAAEADGEERKAVLKSLAEMAQCADSFLQETLAEVCRLPMRERVFSVGDSKKAAILSIEDSGIKVLYEGGGESIVPVASVGADTLILFHRDIVSKPGMNPASVVKRHEDAVVFLYLTGATEKAEQAASALMINDADFAVRWERWMQTLSSAL